MKKIILTFVAITVMLFTTDAQTKKGTVLLGAGSQFSDTEWTQWSITPKIGYFIQDGLAIGAMVHFDTDDQYFPAYDGVAVPNAGAPGGVEIIGAHDEYTLTNNSRTFGVFGRYYAARNLFMEVNMSSSTTQTESWGTMSTFEVVGGVITLVESEGVMQSRSQSTHLN